MIASKTSLFNQALNRIGETRISDAESTSDVKAIIMREFYQQAIDEVLRDYPWSCATERAVLALDAGDNFTTYEYKYQLPPECLRVNFLIEVEEGNYGVVPDAYSLKGKYLYCNYPEVGIEYIKQITLASDLDTLLAESVVLNLAAKSAFAITKDRSIEADMVALFDKALLKAKSADGYERVNRAELPEKWVDIG